MAPIKVRKNGVEGWPWTIWCAFCNDTHNDAGVNSPIGWRNWNKAFFWAFRHSFEHKDKQDD